MEIPKKAAPIIYKAAKNLYSGKLSVGEAIAMVNRAFILNSNTLKDYFRGFRMMMEGIEYKANDQCPHT